MSIHRIAASFSNAFAGTRPTARLEGGIDAARRPVSDDVRRLGIDPRAFLSMGHG